MDLTDYLRDLIRTSADVEGVALITTDGVLIESVNFAPPDDPETGAAYCAAALVIAQQLGADTNRGRFDQFYLKGQNGYLIIMPIGDQALLAVLAREGAKLGLIFLDMGGFIKGFLRFAGDPIFPWTPPNDLNAHARPEYDDE